MIKNHATGSPESIVLEMDLPTIRQLLEQLNRPSGPVDAALFRQRIQRGESVDQILDSFQRAARRRAG
ncbi:hypothetical protein FYK55_05590 [Roseiconus nitratireducens]|uniref:Uncharacterized protein n=1 Tax=Roseiconus nitratireducens TaxID=2605748 RepID=A0A5M6DC72_9BACT|nr:hypothetical protein [Roseiconus nitratireducens]KAA5545147.1 hypothetical protein FYK55_05590 [Roseiconus nitratireducens]